MKRFRLRLSSILWLVALVAAFLAGIRYGEYRATARSGGVVRAIVITTDHPARSSPKTAESKVQVDRGE
jgi:hypothetical protein